MEFFIYVNNKFIDRISKTSLKKIEKSFNAKITKFKSRNKLNKIIFLEAV